MDAGLLGQPALSDPAGSPALGMPTVLAPLSPNMSSPAALLAPSPSLALSAAAPDWRITPTEAARATASPIKDWRSHQEHMPPPAAQVAADPTALAVGPLDTRPQPLSSSSLEAAVVMDPAPPPTLAQTAVGAAPTSPPGTGGGSLLDHGMPNPLAAPIFGAGPGGPELGPSPFLFGYDMSSFLTTLLDDEDGGDKTKSPLAPPPERQVPAAGASLKNVPPAAPSGSSSSSSSAGSQGTDWGGELDPRAEAGLVRGVQILSFSEVAAEAPPQSQT